MKPINVGNNAYSLAKELGAPLFSKYFDEIKYNCRMLENTILTNMNNEGLIMG